MVYQEPKTLGHFASRKTSKMGRYELESKRRPQEERDKAKRAKAPWWREGTKRIQSELITATTDERKHYMETGNLPPKRTTKKCKPKKS